MDDHQDEGDDQVEDQPDVDHFDVGGCRQTFINLEQSQMMDFSKMNCCGTYADE